MATRGPEGNSTAEGSNAGQAAFPRTHWSRLEALQGDVSAARREALEYLAQRYWRPVYVYVRRQRYNDEQAQDLVQEFFLRALARDLFARADPARGRFRNFLLKSLQRFLANAYRDAHARIRHPARGFVPIDELASESGAAALPPDTLTPDEAFHWKWLRELVRRVLRTLEIECQATGKQTHFELLHQRVIAPLLEGAEPPSLRDLAQRHGLSEKDVENRVITARRAYQRLLRQEIRLYATSDEEIAAEIQDLWRFMAE
ncbi:MAG: sigma-70 family RNA polymerase sigma factor [Verrucomicrobia bacterium]|nr:sigma-70 family RNA polymerase sigma factor [Verrucomicrobiota bacterium]